MNMNLPEFSKEVWRENYRAPGEKTVKDTWERQSKTAANVENEKVKEKIYQDFLWLFEDFKGVSGGRITSNLGVEGREGTTLYNCFTNSPIDLEDKDPDSIKGIYELLKSQALTLKSEGGYGMNFSWLRPNGVYVKGIGGRTPGVLKFLELWNKSSEIITMGSKKILGEKKDNEKIKMRKGAQLALLECWHPEIESYIDAKSQPHYLEKFNLSVGIINGFMEAVENDQMWNLKFPNTDHEKYKTEWFGDIEDWELKGYPVIIYKKIKAKDLWDKIVKSTYTRNDPGVIFLDIANKFNSLSYAEKINASNPCVAPETKILTDEGHFEIKHLEGKYVNVWNGSSFSNVLIRKTGINKELIKINFSNGVSLECTKSHIFYIQKGFADDIIKEVIAEQLTPGDKLIKYSLPIINKSDVVFKDAYTHGLFSAEGTHSKNTKKIQKLLDLYGNKKKLQPLLQSISKIYINPKSNRIRCYFESDIPKFTVPINNYRLEDKLNWFAGYADGDGNIQIDSTKNQTLVICSINKKFLLDIKLMLQTIGVDSKVLYAKNEGTKLMPDGKGGLKKYNCKKLYRILVSSNGLYELSLLGWKTNRLTYEIRKPNRNASQFIKVNSIEKNGRISDTYCFSEPLKHMGMFNGVLTGQCGEVTMGGSSVCNLFSINVVKYIKRLENGDYIFDYENFRKASSNAVRFSDNINDISRVPLPMYKKSIEEKRRIGIGVMGLGSLHYILGIRYGSEESLKFIDSLFKVKAETEILASAKLGKEKGSFKLFDREKYFNTYWWKNLPISEEVKREVESIGEMRNSHRSANAPTGNNSIYVGIVSGGIEPVFDKEYVRWTIVTEHEINKLRENGFKFPDIHAGEWFETKHMKITKKGTDEILLGTFEDVKYQIDKNRGLTKGILIEDYGWRFVKNNFSPEKIQELQDKGVFVTAQDLNIDEHINPLKIIAKYTDLNSSKTINVPADYPFEDFKNVYMDAWKSGIKGITTYRAGTMAAVLEKKEEDKEKRDDLEAVFKKANGNVISEKMKLPDEYYSKGYVIKDNNKKKWYVNIAFADQKLTKPFAIFVGTNCKESQEVADDTIHAMLKLAKEKGIRKELIDEQVEKYIGQTNVIKIARAIGFLLRHNIPIIEVVNVLDEGNYPFSSFTFHIRRLLKQFVKDGTPVTGKHAKCIKCGSVNIIYEESCYKCRDCSWSKCG